VQLFSKSSSLFFLSTAMVTFISLATLPVVTKTLGPENYGLFEIFMVISSTVFVWIRSSFGYVLSESLPKVAGESRVNMVGCI
jgi:O-antigen/teichoic acid export membrane protein